MNLMNKLVSMNLKLNRKRSTVTVVGIILAVALLTALFSLVTSFRVSFIEYERKSNGNQHACFFDMDEEGIETIKANRAVELYYTVSNQGYALIDGCQNEGKPYAYLCGMDQTAMKNSYLQLVEGRLPEKEGEVLIPRHLKTNGRVEYHVGDTITLDIGKRVSTEDDGYWFDQSVEYQEEREALSVERSKTYTVVGIMERPGYRLEPYSAPGYTFVTLPEETTYQTNAYVKLYTSRLPDKYKVLAGIMGIDSDMYEQYMTCDYESAEELDNNYEQRKYDCDVNTGLIRVEQIWPVDQTFLILYEIGAFVALIIIFTSVYCIKNSFEISVTEKIRQYGMLAGIGATKKQIRASVFKEAQILGGIGLPIGLFCGLFAAWILTIVSNIIIGDAMTIQIIYNVNWVTIFVALVLSIVTIYLSAVRGANLAAKVSPIEAIRNQREIKVNKRDIKTPAFISKLWGIGGVISYKNIKRNRKKYRTTVVSIIVCTVTFIVTSFFVDLTYYSVGLVYNDNGANLNLSLFEENSPNASKDHFKNLNNIEKICAYSNTYWNCMNTEWTEEYTSLMSEYEMFLEDIDYCTEFIIMDDESFAEYAKACRANKDLPILCNTVYIENLGEMKALDAKVGDVIQIQATDFTNAQYDENDNLIEGTAEDCYSEITIGAITGDVPDTLSKYMYAEIFMSESYANSLEVMKVESRGSTELKIITKKGKADSVQDAIEEYIESEMPNQEYYLYNRDKNKRDEESLFLLLSIFAYGLITVIALIGITNIVNTLSTSVELRAREFATLRSVGMTSKQFNRMVRLESFFTSAKSLLFGLAIGIALTVLIWAFFVKNDTLVAYRFPLGAVVISLAVVNLLVYAIIKLTLSQVNKRNIIETIKNENL